MKIIFIDTMIMMEDELTLDLPGYLDGSYDYRKEQNIFFEREVQNCDSTYCIVAGHHPIYSIGSHGPEIQLIEVVLIVDHNLSPCNL